MPLLNLQDLRICVNNCFDINFDDYLLRSDKLFFYFERFLIEGFHFASLLGSLTCDGYKLESTPLQTIITRLPPIVLGEYKNSSQ